MVMVHGPLGPVEMPADCLTEKGRLNEKGEAFVENVYREAKAATQVSIKHDSGKPAVEYIPVEALFAMGEAYGYGAKKYGGYNFQLTGLEVTRCLAASIRHIYLFLSGEDNDKESGLSHLGHALAAIGMAIYSLTHFPAKDNRFKKLKTGQLSPEKGAS